MKSRNINYGYIFTKNIKYYWNSFNKFLSLNFIHSIFLMANSELVFIHITSTLVNSCNVIESESPMFTMQTAWNFTQGTTIIHFLKQLLFISCRGLIILHKYFSYLCHCFWFVFFVGLIESWKLIFCIHSTPSFFISHLFKIEFGFQSSGHPLWKVNIIFCSWSFLRALTRDAPLPTSIFPFQNLFVLDLVILNKVIFIITFFQNFCFFPHT